MTTDYILGIVESKLLTAENWAKLSDTDANKNYWRGQVDALLSLRDKVREAVKPKIVTPQLKGL